MKDFPLGFVKVRSTHCILSSVFCTMRKGFNEKRSGAHYTQVNMVTIFLGGIIVCV